jgi:hypothetical protein
MVFKLIKVPWKNLVVPYGKYQLPKVMIGVKFCDGCEIIATDEGDAGGYARSLSDLAKNRVMSLNFPVLPYR